MERLQISCWNRSAAILHQNSLTRESVVLYWNIFSQSLLHIFWMIYGILYTITEWSRLSHSVIGISGPQTRSHVGSLWAHHLSNYPYCLRQRKRWCTCSLFRYILFFHFPIDATLLTYAMRIPRRLPYYKSTCAFFHRSASNGQPSALESAESSRCFRSPLPTIMPTHTPRDHRSGTLSLFRYYSLLVCIKWGSRKGSSV